MESVEYGISHQSIPSGMVRRHLLELRQMPSSFCRFLDDIHFIAFHRISSPLIQPPTKGKLVNTSKLHLDSNANSQSHRSRRSESHSKKTNSIKLFPELTPRFLSPIKILIQD